MNYIYHLLIYLAIYVIVSQSLNLIVGYCGRLTMAHASFFAAGSYAYGLIVLRLGWGFVPAVILATLTAGLLSVLLTLPSWRLRGDFFFMASLAVQTLLYSIIYNWSSPHDEPGSWANLTNGPFGLPGVPRPTILGQRLQDLAAIAALALAVAGVVSLLIWVLLRSPWGRALQTMRDDELAARGLGKNVHLLKAEAFGLSCAIAGIGGALYASYVGYVDPSLASLDRSVLFLSMVLVGGVGNFVGPLVGAALLLLIPETLRFVHIPDSLAAELRLMIYGLLLVVLTHLRPQGLAGVYRVE